MHKKLSKVTIMTSMMHINPWGPGEGRCIAIRKLKRPNGKWFIQEVYRPKVFEEFNKYMGGVDRT